MLRLRWKATLMKYLKPYLPYDLKELLYSLNWYIHVNLRVLDLSSIFITLFFSYIYAFLTILPTNSVSDTAISDSMEILAFRIPAGAADYTSFFMPQCRSTIRAYAYDIPELIFYHRMRRTLF